MQLSKFGIEIRRLDSVQDLYRDVNRTLAAVGVKGNQVSDLVKTQTVAHALQELFTQSYFSYYAMEKAAEVVNLVIPSERVKIYRAVGSLDYNRMTPEYRQTLIAMILDDFRSVLLLSEEAQLVKL